MTYNVIRKKIQFLFFLFLTQSENICRHSTNWNRTVGRIQCVPLQQYYILYFNLCLSKIPKVYTYTNQNYKFKTVWAQIRLLHMGQPNLDPLYFASQVQGNVHVLVQLTFVHIFTEGKERNFHQVFSFLNKFSFFQTEMTQTRLLHFASVSHGSTLFEKNYVGSMTDS